MIQFKNITADTAVVQDIEIGDWLRIESVTETAGKVTLVGVYADPYADVEEHVHLTAAPTASVLAVARHHVAALFRNSPPTCENTP